jgi:hypothetical protein
MTANGIAARAISAYCVAISTPVGNHPPRRDKSIRRTSLAGSIC